MTPQEAATRLHARLHAKEPRAWQIALAIKKLVPYSDRAANAWLLLRAAHQAHMTEVHDTPALSSGYRHFPVDGRPIVGGYGFPKSCTAGVCFSPNGTVVPCPNKQLKSRNKNTTGANVELPTAIVQNLKNMMVRATFSSPPQQVMVASAYSVPNYDTMNKPMGGAVVPAGSASPNTTSQSTVSSSAPRPSGINLATPKKLGTFKAPATGPVMQKATNLDQMRATLARMQAASAPAAAPTAPWWKLPGM